MEHLFSRLGPRAGTAAATPARGDLSFDFSPVYKCDFLTLRGSSRPDFAFTNTRWQARASSFSRAFDVRGKRSTERSRGKSVRLNSISEEDKLKILGEKYIGWIIQKMFLCRFRFIVSSWNYFSQLCIVLIFKILINLDFIMYICFVDNSRFESLKA